MCYRPRRRRLEVFTTDAKIIRLISRRVAIFPTAAVQQFFSGDCDAADLKNFWSDAGEVSHPVGYSEMNASLLIKSCIRHCIDCLFAVFKVILPSRHTAFCLHHHLLSQSLIFRLVGLL